MGFGLSVHVLTEIIVPHISVSGFGVNNGLIYMCSYDEKLSFLINRQTGTIMDQISEAVKY